MLTIEQLQNINRTVLHQRDEAETKVQQLVTLIDDVIWEELSGSVQKIVAKVLSDLDV